MRACRPYIVLLGVALSAALIAHVTIDVLGDYLLAHDTYDDLDHSSRELVAFGTLLITLLGAAFAVAAAVREARGSENAFCRALRSALPTSAGIFTAGATATAVLALCGMEFGDALVAHQRIDDVGDLFGGSVLFGGTIVSAIATALSLATLQFIRLLARSCIITHAVVALLRRRLDDAFERETFRECSHRLIYRVHVACRRVAGRAPPPPLRTASSSPRPPWYSGIGIPVGVHFFCGQEQYDSARGGIRAVERAV